MFAELDLNFASERSLVWWNLLGCVLLQLVSVVCKLHLSAKDALSTLARRAMASMARFGKLQFVRNFDPLFGAMSLTCCKYFTWTREKPKIFGRPKIFGFSKKTSKNQKFLDLLENGRKRTCFFKIAPPMKILLEIGFPMNMLLKTGFPMKILFKTIFSFVHYRFCFCCFRVEVFLSLWEKIGFRFRHNWSFSCVFSWPAWSLWYQVFQQTKNIFSEWK